MNRFILVVFLSALALSGCGFEQVDTGHRGVKVTWGEVDEKAGSMPEGLYWYNPFSSNIYEMDVRVSKWESDTEAYTKDVQQAKIGFAVTYALDSEKAHMIFKEVGRDWADRLLSQVVVGSMKDAIGKWEAEKLITNRELAQKEAGELIRSSMAPKFVAIKDFQITNIDYSDQFEKAVEDKVVAQQRAIEEANRTKQVEEQAKQTIEKAKAEAQSITIRASALEKNAKLIELEAVNKWNGVLPQYVLGGAVPFIDVGGKK